MSNDVERLRQALRDKAQENWERGRRDAPLLSVNDAMEVLEQMGVTLPTPPRATPLEAACRKRYPSWDALGASAKAVLGHMMAADITAAVGALSEEDVRAVGRAYAYPDCDDGVVEARGVLLVRLTEGGAT